MIGFTCGVESGCTGAFKLSAARLGKGMKVHSTREEAFKCKSDALVRAGYQKVGGREFAPTDGGPILVLTKRARFGMRLRSGKEGGRVMLPKGKFIASH